MTYKGTLIAVSDMEASKKFYQELLGMKITGDFGANVQLENGLFLQTRDSWEGFIEGRPVALGHNAGELYFEVPDMDAFLPALDSAGVEYIHRVKEHTWGQRAVRFYDPDHHIIEVAEDIAMVARRFSAGGMTPEQVAARMDVPLAYVRGCLA